MENISGFSREDEQIELPPGFRFHPTDEELISHYLSPKVLDSSFCAKAIGEVDLNKVEPWDLPWRAKMGEKEWYFFCVRDRKYPTGLRTNRATDAGYWKATGKDKEIYKSRHLVGMKKTLVFYRGRAPKGEKTNWVMHEYRLEGKNSGNNLPKSAKNEWVICRVFQKTTGGKKMHISGLVRLSNYGDEFRPNSNMPPLLDLSAFDTPDVTCFSSSMEDQKPQDMMAGSFSSLLLAPSSSTKPFDFSSVYNQSVPNIQNMQYPDSFLMMQDQNILRHMLENNGASMKQNTKAELSQDTGMSTDISSAVSNHEMGQGSYEDQDYNISSAGPVDLDCIWNY